MNDSVVVLARGVLPSSPHLLILSLHHLDVLSELDDPLSIRLEPKLCDHSKLNLGAKWKNNLLIPGHQDKPHVYIRVIITVT